MQARRERRFRKQISRSRLTRRICSAQAFESIACAQASDIVAIRIESATNAFLTITERQRFNNAGVPSLWRPKARAGPLYGAAESRL
jgi:hypothetical protein